MRVVRSAVAPADRVAGLLAGAGEVVTGEAARWLSGMEPEDERIIGYQLGLWDADGRPGAGGGGKWVRAALTLSCARAAGGDPREALRGAGAVELLHTLSLLYDDAMDRDAVRRARPSAWRVFGAGPPNGQPPRCSRTWWPGSSTRRSGSRWRGRLRLRWGRPWCGWPWGRRWTWTSSGVRG